VYTLHVRTKFGFNEAKEKSYLMVLRLAIGYLGACRKNQCHNALELYDTRKSMGTKRIPGVMTLGVKTCTWVFRSLLVFLWSWEYSNFLK